MLARNEWLSEVPNSPATIAHRAPGARIADRLRLWRTRIRERDELATLDERDLRDARISRADVLAETRKPFWCP